MLKLAPGELIYYSEFRRGVPIIRGRLFNIFSLKGGGGRLFEAGH